MAGDRSTVAKHLYRSGMNIPGIKWLERWSGPFCIAFVIAMYMPMLLRWDNAYVVIHDNLDSEITYLKVLHASGTAYETDPAVRIPQVMDGIPRAFYRSGFNSTVLLFGLMPPHAAYIIGCILAHLMALFGMRYLLLRHFLREPEQAWAAWLVSTCFAVLPFYSAYGLTIAAQPFLLSAFLSFRTRTSSFADTVIVLLFPFTVLNYMVTPFAGVVLGAMGLYDLARERKWNMRYWVMLVVLGAVFIVVESGLLRSMFGAEAHVSHRVEWRISDLMPADFGEGLRTAISFFLHGHYHTGLFYSAPILAAVALAVIFFRSVPGTTKAIGVVALTAVFIAFFPFYYWLIQKFGERFPFISYFTGNRFFFLTPVLWVLALGIAANALIRKSWGKITVVMLCCAHLWFAVRNDNEIMYNMRLLRGGTIDQPTYAEFYSAPIFQRMTDRIGGDPATYRVASLGLPPNIAQFNGFFTLDSYQNNYELAYKHRFRPIIAPELDKSADLKEYYDAWGSRCYLWSAELGKRYDLYKSNTVVLKDTWFDLDTFKSMGGAYIISAVVIEGALRSRLELMEEFADPSCAWQLRLYKVN